MRKFEIPFRVDTLWSNFVSLYKPFIPQIECIYFASYSGDGQTTRKIIERDFHYPNSFEEYVDILYEVRRYFDLQVLIQRNCSMDLIDKYYELGIKRFVINNDVLAREIKKKYKDIILVLSITRRIKYEEIINSDFSMYDFIVLDVWFCRHIDFIKKLPTKYRYILMPNNTCCWQYHDKCFVHWFDEFNFDYCPVNNHNKAEVLPNDLKYFDDYISHYKIQGRELEMSAVYRESLYYFERPYEYYNLGE